MVDSRDQCRGPQCMMNLETPAARSDLDVHGKRMPAQSRRGRGRVALSPPFRADHVGSLLRPATLVAARARHARGELSAPELRRAEDDAISAVVARQEAIGLQSITDGELRRDYWHIDFLRRLEGVTIS